MHIIRHVHSKTNGYHTHIQLDIQQACWLTETQFHSVSESNMPICLQSDMQSHTYSTVHTHKPTQTLTHLHTPSCGLAHTQIHTHPQCPWTDTNTHRLHTFTVTHIYPFLGPDASKPQAGFSPFLIKCFFRKVYSVPRSPTPSYPHHGVFLVSDFPLLLPWP